MRFIMNGWKNKNNSLKVILHNSRYRDSGYFTQLNNLKFIFNLIRRNFSIRKKKYVIENLESKRVNTLYDVSTNWSSSSRVYFLNF